MNSAHALTLFTAYRASTIAWSGEAKAFFAAMERAERAFPTAAPPPEVQADIRAAVAREDAAASPYEIGSALHAADWQRNVEVSARWEGWSRRQREKIAAAYPAKRRRAA